MIDFRVQEKKCWWFYIINKQIFFFFTSVVNFLASFSIEFSVYVIFISSFNTFLASTNFVKTCVKFWLQITLLKFEKRTNKPLRSTSLN